MRGDPRHVAARPDAPDTGRVAVLIEPVLGALGMELEALRVTTAGRRRLLRVVVDSDSGVSLDDTAAASRELSAALDAADVMGDAPYTLEVSSPGVDRPLTQPRHWRRAAGRLVKVSIVPAGVVEGRVVSADETGVTLSLDGGIRRFGYSDLGPGEVQIEFGRPDDQPQAADEPAADGTRATAGRPETGNQGCRARVPGAEPDGH